jgi:hypothetical protein
MEELLGIVAQLLTPTNCILLPMVRLLTIPLQVLAREEADLLQAQSLLHHRLLIWEFLQVVVVGAEE